MLKRNKKSRMQNFVLETWKSEREIMEYGIRNMGHEIPNYLPKLQF